MWNREGGVIIKTNDLIISTIVGIITGVLLAYCFTEDHWEKEMVNRGFAEYNQTNGQWQWKESGK
jgi:hypothetical protein